MTATAADYSWFSARYGGLAEAYCFTLVHGLSPAEVSYRMGASAQFSRQGLDGIMESAGQMWGKYPSEYEFVAVTAVGNWALVVEPNGYLGVTPEVIIPLSQGTRLVSHFRDINAADQFCWLENGDVRLDFEPLFPNIRSGSDPDGLLPVMQQLGFDLREDDEANVELHSEAAFALAEYLTGVQLTPVLLDSVSFLCGPALYPRDEQYPDMPR